MPVPQVTAARAGSETWEWLGVRLKSLDTLGERSATGMDSERGVYVISLDGLNSPLRDFLSPGDVILEYDGSPVRDLDGFKAVAGDHQPGKPVIFKIFRSQRLQMVTLP